MQAAHARAKRRAMVGDAVLVFRAATSLALLAAAGGEFYDTFTGRQISPAKYQEYERLNLVPYCAIEVQPCNENEPRRLDYSCNNLHYPSRGAVLTPYRRMLPPMFDANSNHRPSSSGTPLPNARAARTAIMSDGRVASKTYTQLVPNGAVFITGDITSVHDTVNYVAATTTCCASGETDPRCMPIQVPDDDVHLRYSNVRCLNLTKVITYQTLGCAPATLPPERINTSPPMLEMSLIYGHDEAGARRAREGSGGRLKQETQNGAVYPPSGSQFCMQNQRPAETRCHNTPSPATNALIGSNVMSIWFWRNHNRIARQLEALNPCWDDERLYFEAREINIAMMNQISYYELMPSIIGFDYLLKSKAIFETSGHVDDYDPTLEPRVSIEYVIGSRWFHSMQEGRLKTYDTKGRLLNELKAVELSLRTGMLPNNRTLEGLTQGAFRQPAAESDHLIDPDMGERVLGDLQAVSDVAASDIMKSREAGLPPYNHYRKLCGLPVAKDFDDLKGWMYQEQIDGLKQTYEDVDDIDFMVGIMAEKRMRGAAVGPTLACVMTDQLVWWRRADRFWYENSVHPGAFNQDQLREIRETTLSRLICDNGDEVDKIQPFAFFVPREDNELVDCKLLRAPRLEPWKDDQCQNNLNDKLQQQQNILNNNQQILNVQSIGYNQQALHLKLVGLSNQQPNQQKSINAQSTGFNNKQQIGNQNVVPNKNQQTGILTPTQKGISNQQLFTNAIPSSNTNWDQNNLDRDWNLITLVNNWSPGYMQDIRWGQGFVTTQSPVRNNNQGSQGANNNNNSPNTGVSGPAVTNNGPNNKPSTVNAPKNMSPGVNALNNKPTIGNPPNNITPGGNTPNNKPPDVNPSVIPLGGSPNIPSTPSNTNWPTNTPANENWPANMPPNANWPTNMPANANWPTDMPPNGNWPTATPSNTNWPTNMPTNGNWPANMPPNANWPTNMPANANRPTGMPPNGEWPTKLPADLNWLNNLPPGASGWLNNVPANIIKPTNAPTGEKGQGNTPKGANTPNNMPTGANTPNNTPSNGNTPNNTSSGGNKPNNNTPSTGNIPNTPSGGNKPNNIPQSVNTPSTVPQDNSASTTSNKSSSNSGSSTANNSSTTRNNNSSSSTEANSDSPNSNASMVTNAADSTPPTNVMPIRRAQG